MTHRSRAVTAVRSRVLPIPPPPQPQAPLPEPVGRAINREPIDEEEWPYEDIDYSVVPVPGGCIMVGTPRRRYR